MAGIRILTDLEGTAAMDTVRGVARRHGFAVSRTDEWELLVQKGSLTASIFVGAFVAYCYFPVRFYCERPGETEIEIERNSPWWTGILGVNRVKNWAKTLADSVEDALEDQGWQVLKRREY
jgi:hypothetical protein